MEEYGEGWGDGRRGEGWNTGDIKERINVTKSRIKREAKTKLEQKPMNRELKRKM
jgi:hypothetical protein